MNMASVGLPWDMPLRTTLQGGRDCGLSAACGHPAGRGVDLAATVVARLAAAPTRPRRWCEPRPRPCPPGHVRASCLRRVVAQPATALIRPWPRPSGHDPTNCLRPAVAQQVVASTRPRRWRDPRPRPRLSTAARVVCGQWSRGRSWRGPDQGRGCAASHDLYAAALLA